MKKSPPLLLLLLLAFPVVSSCASSSAPYTEAISNDAEAAFSLLRTLAGTWRRSGDGQDEFRIVFSLTANDTVLVESWTNGRGVHSLTIYHRDKENLLATHYCPQGNQPRLKMTQSDSDRMISFHFQDATNLASLDHSHQSALSFEIENSGDSMIRREAYTSAEGTQQSSLELLRVP